MSDRAWKQEERHVARLLGGTRYPANSGGRVDVESGRYVVQVKHVARLSLAQLESLALEMEVKGRRRGKAGLPPGSADLYDLGTVAHNQNVIAHSSHIEVGAPGKPQLRIK